MNGTNLQTLFLGKQKLARFAWFFFLVSLLLIIGQWSLPLVGCPFFSPGETGSIVPILLPIGLSLSGFLFAAIGLLLSIHRSENLTGRLLAIIGFTLPTAALLSSYVECSLASARSFHFAGVAVWLSQYLSGISILVLFAFVPALFPTGKFASLFWQRSITVAAAFSLFLILLASLAPGPMNLNGIIGAYPLENPFRLPFPWLRTFESVLYIAIPLSTVLASLLGASAFLFRFSRSTGELRQQLKWLSFFLTTIVTTHLLGFEFIGSVFYPAIFNHWSYGVIVILSFAGFPLVIGLAIFKYRLYALDLIIRRTLVYTALSASLAVVYFGGVTLLQSLFSALSARQSTLAIVLSTLLIAAMFNPLRRRLQRFIDRRFYRSSYNAQQTLERFSTHARKEVELRNLTLELVRAAHESLQPEKISLWLKPSEKIHLIHHQNDRLSPGDLS